MFKIKFNENIYIKIAVSACMRGGRERWGGREREREYIDCKQFQN